MESISKQSKHDIALTMTTSKVHIDHNLLGLIRSRIHKCLQEVQPPFSKQDITWPTSLYVLVVFE